MELVRPKLKWLALGGNRLQVSAEVDPNNYTFLNESIMDPVQKWCQEHNCGIRMSFDIFKFKNKKEITMFLLRWG